MTGHVRGVGVHRPRRPPRPRVDWVRVATRCAMAASLFVGFIIGWAAFDEAREIAARRDDVPRVVTLMPAPVDPCPSPAALHSPRVGAQQGSAVGARVGCDLVVAQLADTAHGVAP